MASVNLEPTLALQEDELRTPSKAGRRDIYEFYNYFDKLLKLDLPIPKRDLKESPSKSPKTLRHEIILKIKILFFQDHDLLDTVTIALANCRPRVSERNDRHQFVLEQLNDAVLKVRFGKSPKPVRRRLDVTTTPLNRIVKPSQQDIEYDPPPSPTLAIKHMHTHPTRAPAILESKSDNSSFTDISITTSFMSETSRATSSTAATSLDGANDHRATELTGFCCSPVGPQRALELERNALASSSVQPSHGAVKDIKTIVDPQQELFSAPLNFVSPTKPSLQHHRVSRIISDGLAPQDIPSSLHKLRPDLTVEAYRVMRALGLSPEDFEKDWPPARTASSLYKFAEHCGISVKFVRGLKKSYGGNTTMCGKLRFSERRDGPFFDLDLLPPRKEASNQFQRKFGSSRILVVDLPDFSKLPTDFKGQKENVMHMVKEMLSNETSFLGKRWAHFLVRDKKNRKRWLPEFDLAENGAFQAFFFAVSGYGLKDVSITKFLDWAVPLQLNKHQPSCKAYARIDLAVSNTHLGIVFDDNQLHYDVDDQLSNNVPDDEIFTDPQLLDLSLPRTLKPKVMNDGCCSISRGAMRIIAKNLGLKQEIYALQGRICGAKGLWYVDPDDDIWINISHSQIKSRHSREEIANDQHLRTLNVLNVSRSRGSSILHPGFLPILRDRGVPEAAILDITRGQVKMDTQEFLQALDDNGDLHRLIFSRQLSESRRRNNMEIVDGFPNTSGERVACLLESGFQPKKCVYLKNEILAVGSLMFSLKAKQFKIRLSRSTVAWGICDPSNKLPPGFAHFASSVPLTDDATGETWTNLHGREVLVSRNPSRRNSDIQKIRMVYEPELAHLQDVIVFSAQGPRPLASKLSGGDYDGDTFWVCWEQSLVLPFQNAPAPWEPDSEEELNQKLEFFGLTRDKTTLGEIIGEESAGEDLNKRVRLWIKHGTAARLGQQWLGRVSNLHVAVTYEQRSISSRIASLLVDLHDLVIDADKQGYRYTEEGFELFKRRMMIRNGLPKPAHHKFTGRVSHQYISECGIPQPDPSNIVDQLYFTVVEPEIQKALLQAKSDMRDATADDTELSALYDDMSESMSEVIQGELVGLRNSLLEVGQSWSKGMQKYYSGRRKSSDWDYCVRQCRDQFLRITPQNQGHPTVVEWLRRRGKAPTVWEELKVSSLAKLQHGSEGKLMFSIAGAELCRAKAQVSKNCRLLRMDIYRQMKPHKLKAENEFKNPISELELEDEDYSDALDDDEDSLFDVDESLFENIDPAPEAFVPLRTPSRNGSAA